MQKENLHVHKKGLNAQDEIQELTGVSNSVISSML